VLLTIGLEFWVSDRFFTHPEFKYEVQL